MIDRRSFLTGTIASAVVAPSIVRATSIMPIRGTPHLTTIDASYQAGSTIIVRPLTSVLNVGDIITVEGVEAWSRRNDEPLGRPREFVVTARADAGARAVHIYPQIIGEHDPRYRTVVNYPMNMAEVKRLSFTVPVFG